jgi:hypothetical protein
LQRHSKSKGNAVVARQKSHFAKVRSKISNKRGPSTQDWNDISSVRSTSPPPFKKSWPRPRLVATDNQHSPRVQKWSVTKKRHSQQLVTDDAIPPRNSHVHVNIGRRAFESQINTTVASPSTRIRSCSASHSDGSSGSMLLDVFDRPHPSSKDSRVSVNTTRECKEDDSRDRHPESEEAQRVLSDALDKILDIQEESQRFSNPPLHESLEMNGTVDVSPVRAQHGDALSFGHKTLGDNNDDAWRQFIEEDASLEQEDGEVYAAPYHAKQGPQDALDSWRNDLEEPLHPIYLRDSTPHSSCPTNRPCLLQTGTSRRMSGEASEQKVNGASLSHEEQVWRRFILGSNCTDAT